MAKTIFNKDRGVWIERLEDLTPEWHAARQNGIGASESGRVLGLVDWKGASVIELFFEKIGLKPAEKPTTRASYMGRKMEEFTANTWQFYDGREDSFIENDEAGKIIRKCQRINGIITNEKYPHLFANLDRIIVMSGGFKITDGTVLTENGVLECKTGTSFVSKKWEHGIDPAYLTQLMQQLMCFGVSYGELAYYELDTRKFYVFPVEYDANLVSRIEENTYTFWYKMVLPAREYAKQYLLEEQRGNTVEAQKLLQKISEFEPSADSSESYKDFMNKRWLSEPVVIKGEQDIIEALIEHRRYQGIIQAIEPELSLRENKVRELLGNADTLDLDAWGKVTWRTNEKGSRVLRMAGFKYDASGFANEIKAIIDSKIDE